MAVGLEHDHATIPLREHLGDCLIRAKRDADLSDRVDVVIDLTNVCKINSKDLNELIRLQLRVKHRGQRLVLTNVQETIFQVFSLTRLDRLIELRHDGHFDPPSLHFQEHR